MFFRPLVSNSYKESKQVEQTRSGTLDRVIPPSANQGDNMEKTRNKAKRFFKLDKLSQRIAHAARAIDRQRKERAVRAFERSLMPLS